MPTITTNPSRAWQQGAVSSAEIFLPTVRHCRLSCGHKYELERDRLCEWSGVFVTTASLIAGRLKPGFHSNAIACVNENRKKRKRLRWQAANHGCHCFDRAFLLAGACVCCVFRLRNASDCVWMETGLEPFAWLAIAFPWSMLLHLPWRLHCKKSRYRKPHLYKFSADVH